MRSAVTATRCAEGRLAAAYPVSRHDVELRIGGATPAELTTHLREAAQQIFSRDPRCRRVVFAAHRDELVTIAAAERAGFRYVVDVDVDEAGRRAELSLLVCETVSVTAADGDLGCVPQT